MRLQYASDLHIEKWRKTTFDETLIPAARVLILAGDICPTNRPDLAHTFFEWCSEKWETIVWVPGILEVWGSGKTVDGGVRAMREIVAPFHNIHVLFCESLGSSDGAVILGCPLWAMPPPRQEGGVGTPMIHVTGRIYAAADPPPCDSNEFLREYTRCFRWLQGAVSEIRAPCVVVSHYSPLPWTQQEEWIQDRKSSFNVPIEVEKILRPPIVAWIYGHSHVDNIENYEWSKTTGEEGSVLFVCNPRGFVAPRRSHYSRDEVLRIDPSSFLRG